MPTVRALGRQHSMEFPDPVFWNRVAKYSIEHFFSPSHFRTQNENSMFGTMEFEVQKWRELVQSFSTLVWGRQTVVASWWTVHPKMRDFGSFIYWIFSHSLVDLIFFSELWTVCVISGDGATLTPPCFRPIAPEGRENFEIYKDFIRKSDHSYFNPPCFRPLRNKGVKVAPSPLMMIQPLICLNHTVWIISRSQG